jgi:hypothetical protein
MHEKEVEDFFRWLNKREELNYTEAGIDFYVHQYYIENPSDGE